MVGILSTNSIFVVISQTDLDDLHVYVTAIIYQSQSTVLSAKYYCRTCGVDSIDKSSAARYCLPTIAAFFISWRALEGYKEEQWIFRYHGVCIFRGISRIITGLTHLAILHCRCMHFTYVMLYRWWILRHVSNVVSVALTSILRDNEFGGGRGLRSCEICMCRRNHKSLCTTYGNSPGRKDHEHVRMSGRECMVIAYKLPCDTAWYCSTPFISGSIEN